MPNGDALYLLSKLRSTAGTEHIPFFVVTGRRLDEAARRDLTRDFFGRTGAAEIFQKSFDTEALFTAVKQYCGSETTRVEA